MTQNQLKYWELRWKQHYENAQIQIDQGKLELEINKLYETIRHNKKDERLEKQRLINERIKLSQDWEKIQNDYRAKIVELGINANKVASEWQTKMRSLDQKDREIAQKDIELAQKAEQILMNKFTIVGDLFSTLLENKNKDERERMKLLADAVGPVGKALGLGLLGVLHAKIETTLRSDEYTDFMKYMQDTYPEVFNMMNTDKDTKTNAKIKQYNEMYGPQAPGKLENDIKQYLNTNDPKFDSNERNESVSGHTNTESVTKSNDNQSTGTKTISIGSSGSMYYDNHKDAGSTKQSVQTKTSQGTSVIYSPGSHNGPGFM